MHTPNPPLSPPLHPSNSVALVVDIVVLLDDGPLGGGETARTTAHLVFYNDDGMTTIERSLRLTEPEMMSSAEYPA